MGDAEPPAISGLSLVQSENVEAQHKQQVNPYDVRGEIGEDGVAKAIDYEKLVNDFGTKLLADPEANLLQRFEKVTGHRPHRFMRRGIVFSHRDLDVILDRYEKGEPFFLYTGRGPSSDSMHIGHSVPFEFTKFVILV
jgi:tryptophanyl-tRNA synthetase